MKIDLRLIGTNPNNLEKSSMIIESLTREDLKYNCIFVSVYIYNIIENHKMFKPRVHKDGNVYHVGEWLRFNVYVDLLLPINFILLKYDKEETRNIRIEKLLNGIEIEEEMVVEVKDILI